MKSEVAHYESKFNVKKITTYESKRNKISVVTDTLFHKQSSTEIVRNVKKQIEIKQRKPNMPIFNS
jgi:hypothetical protein